jgi:glycosyltransferase involved in cell wall biosynthesis
MSHGHETGRGGSFDLVVVYRSSDPLQKAHSGSVAGVTGAFTELGLRVALINAEPARAAVRALGALQGKHRSSYPRRAGRLAPAWRSVRSRNVRAVPTLMMVSDAGRPARGPLVTFDDMTVAQAQRHPDYLRPFGSAVEDLEPWRRRQEQLYRHATGCCVGSSWAARSVLEDYGVSSGKVHVVGRGHSFRVECPVRDWSSPRFLFVGRDWARKNGDAVVRGFARLRASVPTAQLDIVGGHPPIAEQGVRLHGTLMLERAGDRARLKALYQRSTCLVMPSLVEAFGISYVEAASFGVPSIGTTVGGARTAIGSDGGVLVDPHDDDAIVGALRRLAVPEEAARMGSAAARRAELFTWRRIAERLAGVLLPADGAPDPSLSLSD